MKHRSQKYGGARRLRPHGGFTLIEIVVSVGIFAVVMSVAAGSLLSTIDANKRARALGLVMDNLNFALASVSRELRVGKNYHCGAAGDPSAPADCPDPAAGDTAMSFESSGGELFTYRFSGNRLERSVDGGPFIGVTSPAVSIQRGLFFVTGAPAGDGRQPRVLILSEGFVSGVREQSRFNIQTTVTERELDS